MTTYKMFKFVSRKYHLNDKAPPPDVQAAFASFAGEKRPSMDASQFLRFLIEYQGEIDATIADAERMIEMLRGHRIHRPPTARPIISIDEFQHYLFSVELNPPIKSQVHHDMTCPLSHYYVYTGHNSYLTGNQLSSDSSAAPIRKSLESGVKVVELDMWPNSTKDNIDIVHGRTLTSPVKLVNCLNSIKENAFCASSYPVVITLEDHLTPDLQAKVAEMIMQTFGNMLFYPESERLKEYPSPHILKERILISTKPPEEYLESNNSKDKKKTEKNAIEKDKECKKGISDYKNDNDQYEDFNEDDQNLLQNAAPEYKQIITITAGKPKSGLVLSLEINPNTVRRLSLSELQLEKAAESYGTNIVLFTQKNILRIYPKGTRFTSSNYNPFIGWMHGAQMVAFNMQGYGKSLWLMQGFFRSNGGCGYVKKPKFLLTRPEDVFDPKAELHVKKKLMVKVFMGDGWKDDFSKTHFDNFSPPDFYTRVGIAGVPADNKMQKTRVIDDDWTPVWNETFTFSLRVPELALLRIEVHEHDISGKSDFAGQTCLPIAELRTGIRAVPLYDKKGVKYNNVRLLMRFVFFEE